MEAQAAFMKDVRYATIIQNAKQSIAKSQGACTCKSQLVEGGQALSWCTRIMPYISDGAQEEKAQSGTAMCQ